MSLIEENYWRGKYDALRRESTTELIRSLRAQITAIGRLTQEETENCEDQMRRILIHVKIALSLKQAE